MSVPKAGQDAECRYHEALAGLIKDLCELLSEDWNVGTSSPIIESKRRINAAIAKALKIAI